jgi:hypothetical protein
VPLAGERLKSTHGRRFVTMRACFSTISVSRPTAGATAGLLSAITGPSPLTKRYGRTRSQLAAQVLEPRLCLFGIGRVEAFGEHCDFISDANLD